MTSANIIHRAADVLLVVSVYVVPRAADVVHMTLVNTNTLHVASGNTAACSSDARSCLAASFGKMSAAPHRSLNSDIAHAVSARIINS